MQEFFLERYRECFKENKENNKENREEKVKFIRQCVENWCIPENVKERENLGLNKLYEVCIKDIDFSPLVNAFKNRLSEINYIFSQSEQVSGAVCFFGGIFTSVFYYGYTKNIEELFTFALCYMLIDHYLDNSKISMESKNSTISNIKDFLNGIEVSGNDILNVGEKRYTRMINKIPSVQDSIKELFYSEIQSFKIENREDMKREDYFGAAVDKGGRTALTIGKIIEIEDEKDLYNSYELGAAIQFIDDLLDVEDDKKENIFTWIRYELKENNETNFITYLYICCKVINNIDKKYNFFKIVLFEGLVLGINDLNICLDLITGYNIFKETSKKELIEWFHTRLYEYIDKKSL